MSGGVGLVHRTYLVVGCQAVCSTTDPRIIQPRIVAQLPGQTDPFDTRVLMQEEHATLLRGQLFAVVAKPFDEKRLDFVISMPQCGHARLEWNVCRAMATAIGCLGWNQAVRTTEEVN